MNIDKFYDLRVFGAAEYEVTFTETVMSTLFILVCAHLNYCKRDTCKYYL